MKNNGSNTNNEELIHIYRRIDGFAEEINLVLSRISSENCYETLLDYTEKNSEDVLVPFSYLLYNCCNAKNYLTEEQKNNLKEPAVVLYNRFSKKLAESEKQEKKRGRLKTDFIEKCIDFFYFQLIFGHVWTGAEKPEGNFIEYLIKILENDAVGFIQGYLLDSLVYFKSKEMIDNSIFFSFISEIIEKKHSENPTEYLSKFLKNGSFSKISPGSSTNDLNRIYNQCYPTLQYEVLYYLILLLNDAGFESFGVDADKFLKHYKNNYEKSNRDKHLPFFILCYIALYKHENSSWFKNLIYLIKYKLHEFDENIGEYSLNWVSFVFLCSSVSEHPECINDIDSIPDFAEAMRYYDRTRIVNFSLDKEFNKKLVFDAFIALFGMPDSDLDTILRFIDLLGINNTYLYVPKNSISGSDTNNNRYEVGHKYLKDIVKNSKDNGTFDNRKLIRMYFNSPIIAISLMTSLAENLDYSSIECFVKNNIYNYDVHGLFADYDFYGYYKPCRYKNNQVVSLSCRNDGKRAAIFISNYNEVKNREFKIMLFHFDRITKKDGSDKYRFYVKGEIVNDARSVVDFGKRCAEINYRYDRDNLRLPYYEKKFAKAADLPLSSRLKMIYDELKDGLYVSNNRVLDSFITGILKEIGYDKELLKDLPIDERIACSYYFIRIAIQQCKLINRQYNVVEYGNKLYGTRHRNKLQPYQFSNTDGFDRYFDDIVTNINENETDCISQFGKFKEECKKRNNQDYLNGIRECFTDLLTIESGSGIKKLYTESIIKYLVPVDTFDLYTNSKVFTIKGILRKIERFEENFIVEFEYLVSGGSTRIRIEQEEGFIYDENNDMIFKYEEKEKIKEVTVRIGEFQRIRAKGYDYEERIIVGEFWGD